MPDCNAMRESMPMLLTESLDTAGREATHLHIESCADCSDEWTALRETWQLLDELPRVEPPAHLKARFLADVSPAEKTSNVVPFQRRPAVKWLAQAAAVVIVAGGSYFAGHRTQPAPAMPLRGAEVTSIQPYSIAETRVLPAKSISPNIEGRPN